MQKKNTEKIKYLSRYKEAKEGEELLEKMLADMESEIMPKAITYSDMPKGSGKNSDLTDYIIKHNNILERLEKMRTEKEIIKMQIFDDITNMKPGPNETDRKLQQDQALLYMRYIQGMKWEEIMEEIGYSWAQVHRIHGRALNNIKMR